MTRALAHANAARPALPKPAQAAAAAYLAAQMREAGLVCPRCNKAVRFRVVRTLHVPGGVMRERKCGGCAHRFYTTERIS